MYTIALKNRKLVMNNIFDDEGFLRIYDDVLMLSDHYRRILSIHQKSLKQCSRVIDLGCGTGNLTLKYLEEGKDVTGIDISAESLGFLKKKVKNNDKLNLIKGDICHLDMIESNSFDGASSMIVAHLVDDFEGHIKEAYRILKPGGIFILTARDYNGKQERLVDVVKKSLIKYGVLEDKFESFTILSKKLLFTANGRSKSLKPYVEVEEILKNIGFNNLQKLENNTKNVMYTIRSQK